MLLPALLKLIHVCSAFWLVSGLWGRALVMSQAARATEMRTVEALVQLAGRFERRVVRPSTFAVLLGGLATAWMQGLPILGVLEGRGPNWILASLVLFVSVFLLIPLVFLPRGNVFRDALQDAVAAGRPTPALAAAFADPAVAMAHTYEWIAVAAVIVLMVTKPF
jgi:uncharacterized membrane protein